MYKCDGIHIVCIYVYMHTCIHARMQENTVENNKFQNQKRLSWDALRQVHGAGSTSVVLLLQIGTWDGMFPNKVELKIESNKYVFCWGGQKNIFDINMSSCTCISDEIFTCFGFQRRCFGLCSLRLRLSLCFGLWGRRILLVGALRSTSATSGWKLKKD